MNIIPLPNNFKINEGFVTITENSGFYADEKHKKGGEMLQKLYCESTGGSIEQSENGLIRLLFEPSLYGEQYKIVIDEQIKLYASSNRGMIWAIQSLRQLSMWDTAEVINCPKGVIEDKPKFGWRGLSMDIARHFFDYKQLCRLVDNMSRMKLNVLHLHLCDDQGIRFESKKFPLLNTVGSFREGTSVRRGGNKIAIGRYGGYLTQEELKNLVAYCSDRGIDIMPEIDIPGHTVAMVASYPRLSCTGKEQQVRQTWGISEDILCAGNDEVINFVKDVLEEICDIFPFGYIHLGGDEAPKKRWKECPKCQERIKQLGLKNEEELQGWFFSYFAEYLKQKGKRTVGWNECLSEELNKDVICQHWTAATLGRNKTTVRHINNGRKAVMSGFTYTYFDYSYAMTPLCKTYRFNAYLKGVKPLAQNNILGVECNVWTEHIGDSKRMDFQVYPRLSAFAENAWSDKLDYNGYVMRLKQYYPVYDKLKINYAKNMEKPLNFAKRLYLTAKFMTKDAYFESDMQKT